MGNPVRDSVDEFVTDGLEHIDINEDAYDEVVEDIEEEDFGYVPWNWPPFPHADDIGANDTIDFFTLGNAINFQFRDPDTGEKYGHERDGQLHEGAFGMWAALHNAYENDPQILEGSYLADLDEDDVADIFAPDNGIELPQIEDRTAILNSVGQRLEKEYDGRFHTLIEEADDRLYTDDGAGYLDRLTDFDAYDDTVEIDGQDIAFHKRAQLAIWMPLGHLQAADDDAFDVQDPQNFEIAADYHFPNIFRSLGLHEYNEELANDIEEGTELEAGGRRETELRAAAVYHGRQLLEELNDRYDDEMTAAGLDGVLFTGYKDEAEDENPVHRVDHTVWY